LRWQNNSLFADSIGSYANDGKEAIVVDYYLPSVGSDLKLDRRCPHCGGPNGNIHSGIRQRAISDLRTASIPQRRMKCPRCGTTWTLRADGVGKGRQRSDRLRGIGVILYMLGLSYRGIEQFLPCLDCRGGKSSIERDLAYAGQQARACHEAAPGIRVRVLGVDGTGAAMAGQNRGILFFVDVERNRLICVQPVREEDTRRVRRHVARVMAAVGAQELRTDEHSVYQGIMEEGRHRICLTHWRKSKGKRAYDLHRQAVAEGRELEARSMQELLALLRLEPRPPTVPPELERLVMRYSRCRKGLLWKINQLLQHVERTWTLVSDDPRDPTNNATERVIGLTFKIRAKTMRGFKAERKVLTHPYLASLLRGEDGICDLRKVI
jgi:transposase-like protein